MADAPSAFKPSRLKVEFWEEGGRWWFHAPMVTGGGCRTMRAAFRHAAEAIEFHREEDKHDSIVLAARS